MSMIEKIMTPVKQILLGNSGVFIVTISNKNAKQKWPKRGYIKFTYGKKKNKKETTLPSWRLNVIWLKSWGEKRYLH